MKFLLLSMISHLSLKLYCFSCATTMYAICEQGLWTKVKKKKLIISQQCEHKL
jgi:uncharacterized protein YjhX (UPF0386 family)